MSLHELLQEKLLEFIKQYGIITGIELWEQYVRDLSCDVLNDFVEKMF